MLFFFLIYIANEYFKVSDCVAIYSLNGALIDDDEILEEIEKFEVLVILRNGEIFGETSADDETYFDQGKFLKLISG